MNPKLIGSATVRASIGLATVAVGAALETDDTAVRGALLARVAVATSATPGGNDAAGVGGLATIHVSPLSAAASASNDGIATGGLTTLAVAPAGAVASGSASIAAGLSTVLVTRALASASGSNNGSATGSLTTITSTPILASGGGALLPAITTDLPIGMWQDRAANPLVESCFKGTPVTGFNPRAPFPGDGKPTADFIFTSQSALNSGLLAAVATSAGMHDPVIEIAPGLVMSQDPVWPVNIFGSWLEIRPTTHAMLSSSFYDPATHDPFTWILENKNITNGEAFHFAAGASRVRIRGFRGRLASGAGLATACFARVAIAENSLPGQLSDRPSQVVIEQFNFDAGDLTTDCRVFLTVVATDFVIRNGRGVKCHTNVSSEAKALLFPYGAQRGEMEDLELQAAGEPWMQGGVKLPNDDRAWVNSDLVFRRGRSYGYKQDGSFAQGSKNVGGEQKTGERILVDGWDYGQLVENGQNAAVPLKCNKEDTNGNFQGGNNNRTAHITMWWIRVHDVPSALVLAGRESGSGHYPPVGMGPGDLRFWLIDRLGFAPYNFKAGNAGPVMLIGNDATGFTLDHWTCANTSGSVTKPLGLAGATPTGLAAVQLSILNAILPQCQYGVMGDGFGEGLSSLNRYVSGLTWRKVALYGGSTNTTYPPDTLFPASQAAALPNAASGSPTSPATFEPAAAYKGIAVDALGAPTGRDLGCIPEWVFARL